jgi:hypothetical protein
VTVDEARKNRLAFDVDSTASRWNCDLATLANSFESIALDHDNGILHRRAASPVDECSALNDQRGWVLRFASRWRQPNNYQDKKGWIQTF